MKHLSSTCLLTLLLLLVTTANSQIRTVYMTRGDNTMMMGYFGSAPASQDQWLNPYLTEEWQEGFIVFSDSIFWDGQLRYDMFRKEMEMVVGGDTVYVSDPFMLNLVAFGEQEFVFSIYIDERGKKPYFGADYFEVLSEHDQAKFLMKRSLRIDEEQFSSSKLLLGLKNEEKMSFGINRSFYLQLSDDDPAVRIRRNKRSVLNILKDHRDEIVAFASENKLGFRKIDDIARIVNYYNSLN